MQDLLFSNLPSVSPIRHDADEYASELCTDEGFQTLAMTLALTTPAMIYKNICSNSGGGLSHANARRLLEMVSVVDARLEPADRSAAVLGKIIVPRADGDFIFDAHGFGHFELAWAHIHAVEDDWLDYGQRPARLTPEGRARIEAAKLTAPVVNAGG